MALTAQQRGWLLIGVGGAAGVILWRRRKQGQQDCEKLANAQGATLDYPCPTTGGDFIGVQVCGSGDYESWRARLGIQLTAIKQLESNMLAAGIQNIILEEEMAKYISLSEAIMADQSSFLKIGRSTVNPVLGQLNAGCQILNQGNKALRDAGQLDYMVAESEEAQRYAKNAKKTYGLMWPLLGIGLVSAGAYYYGLHKAA